MKKFRIKPSPVLISTFWLMTFGIILGLLTRHTAYTPIIGEITSHAGIWILLATVIATHSSTPKTAVIHVFSIFTAMLVSYYLYSLLMIHFLSIEFFLNWAIFTGTVSIGAYATWYSRGNGWIASFASAIPISVLVFAGLDFFQTQSIFYSFQLLAAIFLFTILPQSEFDRLRTLLITIIYVIILCYTGLLNPFLLR